VSGTRISESPSNPKCVTETVDNAVQLKPRVSLQHALRDTCVNVHVIAGAVG
jgi:hypothetical protein